jgi:hypothetical protein
LPKREEDASGERGNFRTCYERGVARELNAQREIAQVERWTVDPNPRRRLRNCFRRRKSNGSRRGGGNRRQTIEGYDRTGSISGKGWYRRLRLDVDGVFVMVRSVEPADGSLGGGFYTLVPMVRIVRMTMPGTAQMDVRPSAVIRRLLGCRMRMMQRQRLCEKREGESQA